MNNKKSRNKNLVHTKLHKVLLLFLIFIVNQSYSQNYISYHKNINKCESLILERKYKDALKLYDKTFSSYDFCFAQDYFVALQVSCFINDTIKTIKYLKKCLNSGVKISYISKDTITKKICTRKFINYRIKNIDSLLISYYKSIDFSYRGFLMELTSIDQYYRDNHQIIHSHHLGRRLIWNSRWKKEIKVLVENRLIPVIIKYGYPGEKLIGLREKWMLSKYKTNDIEEGTALLIFRHYYSFKNIDYSDLFFKELCKGNITPDHYAIIMDYMSKFGKSDNYYNQWHKDPNTSEDNLKKINKKRELIGLETLDEYNTKFSRAIKINTKRKNLPLEYYFKLL